jgi:hypothetical protein
MKGSLYGIGANGLGAKTAAIEKAIKSREIYAASELWDVFKPELQAFVAALHEAVGDNESVPEITEAPPEELSRALERASEAMSRYDSIMAMQELLPFKNIDVKEARERVRLILNALDNIEYEEAIKMINTLLALTGGRLDSSLHN